MLLKPRPARFIDTPKHETWEVMCAYQSQSHGYRPVWVLRSLAWGHWGGSRFGSHLDHHGSLSVAFHSLSESRVRLAVELPVGIAPRIAEGELYRSVYWSEVLFGGLWVTNGVVGGAGADDILVAQEIHILVLGFPPATEAPETFSRPGNRTIRLLQLPQHQQSRG